MQQSMVMFGVLITRSVVQRYYLHYACSVAVTKFGTSVLFFAFKTYPIIFLSDKVKEVVHQ